MADPPFPGSRLVVDAAAVAQAWGLLAARIQPHVDAGNCLLLGVMMGGAVPLVQVSARLRGDFLMDYCHVTRYAGGTEGGAIRWLRPPRLPLAGARVIIIDDIFDEGHTLQALRLHCVEAGARQVMAAVLALKRHGRPVAGPAPEFVGVEVADEYVFGCGMDYRERWRHLDAIYAAPGGAGSP